MKVSAYQKRKLEIEELRKENLRLRNDIYKVIDGDFETTTFYKIQRDFNRKYNELLWAGNSTFKQDKP